MVAPRAGFKNVETAAVSALSYIWPEAWATGSEWGGLVCRSGANSFYSTGPVTQHDGGTVDVSVPLALCKANSTSVGEYHTHGPGGQPYPSGTFVGAAPNDLTRANVLPDLTFFAMTRPLRPTDVGAICPAVGCVATDATPPARSIYRYQGSHSIPNNSINNLYLKLPKSMGDPYMNGGWVVFHRQ